MKTKLEESPIMKRFWVAAAAAFFLAFSAPAVDFYASGDERNEKEAQIDLVKFIGKAPPPVGKFEGKTQKAPAHVNIKDMSDLAAGARAIFRVDLASIKTGMKLRDRDMRDKYLHTDEHPYAEFMLEKISAVYTVKEEDGKKTKTPVKGLAPGVETHLDAEGTLLIRGVKKQIQLKGLRVTYTPESEKTKKIRKGGLLKTVGSFEIDMTDYGVKQPRLTPLFTVDKKVALEFNIVLGTGEKKTVSLPKEDEEKKEDDAPKPESAPAENKAP